MDSLTLTLGIDGDDSLPDVVLPPEPDPWTPILMPGERGWWDAASITGKASGDVIESLPSSGGSVNTLTQVTAGLQPIYNTDFNGTGLPALSFDGSNDCMIMGDLSVSADAPALVMGGLYKFTSIPAENNFKFFMAVRVAGTTSHRAGLFLNNSTGSNKLWAVTYKVPDGATTITRVTGEMANTAAHVIIAEFVCNGDDSPTLKVWRDGTLILNEVPGFSPQNFSEGNSGSAYVGGNPSSANSHIHGLIAQAIIIRGPISTEDRQKLEGYWAHKGGIAENLPDGHPWKAAPPLLDN